METRKKKQSEREIKWGELKLSEVGEESKKKRASERGTKALGSWGRVKTKRAKDKTTGTKALGS